MLIILFAAIIIFLSAKSRFNRAHMEGSSTNYGGGCGGGGGRGPAGRGDGEGAREGGVRGGGRGRGWGRGWGGPRAGRGARVWRGPGLKHNNLLLLIPQLSPNHLHETRI